MSAPAPQEPRRRRLGSLTRKALLGLLLFAAITALWGRDILFDWEHLKIEAERSRRFAQAATGTRLAGTPDLDALDRRLAAEGLSLGAPVFIRIFKREFELELWIRRGDAFHRLATYPVCRWSGRLGPKLAEGDAQAPEGFYTVDAKALNPASRWHRSFNLGFPNVYDRCQNRTGSLLMVHGGCSSIGCYAMTDPVIDEIWRLVTAALGKGQARFHVHVYPFRMTDDGLASHAAARWLPFWRNLKLGHDLFEATRLPPQVSVCNGAYAFAPGTSGSDGSDGSREIDNSCPDLTKSKS